MPSITTLIEDIHKVLTNDGLTTVEPELVQSFADNLAKRIHNQVGTERGKPNLRLSRLGSPCRRQLWYNINTPEDAEALPPAVRLKFLFGDVLEELLLFLARVAGHTVDDEQKEVVVEGVVGHIDGRIDGELVDVKSASSRAFEKFAKHELSMDDPFGYVTQLDSYREAEGDNHAYFLVVDKQFGHLCLDKHDKKGVDYKSMVAETRKMLASPEPPERGYQDEAYGKSGNRKLGTACSYCAFKDKCWPTLRTFMYSSGPVFLTRVDRTPDVPEIRKG